MKDFNIENKNLINTIDIINRVLKKEKIDLKKLFDTFIGSRDELWKLSEVFKTHITNLETSLDKPYFARIDFVSDEDNKKHTLYIGKNGVVDDNEIVVTDWRAPISSLYYDSEVGKCQYEAPQGTMTGEMTLKRQFEIEKGKLLEYFDVDLVSNDNLLQKYLNTNNDARLKTIVSTIQKEQNDVIRKKINNNLIIQGVAGSGKTTVALHRIAYLVYNYMNSIKQNQYLVIGPNPVFIKYIKSVLPDLDVTGVNQCTFEVFAKDFIGEKIIVNSSEKKVNASIGGKINNDIDKFKSSIKYKNMIDKFLKSFISTLVNKDLKVGDFVVVEKHIIEQIFEDSNNFYYSSLNNRIEAIINSVVKYIENNSNKIVSKYNDYCYKVFQQAQNDEERENLRKKFSKEREEIRKNCRNSLRRYFSKSNLDIIKLYKLFISSIKNFDIYNYENINELKKETHDNIKNNCYDFEDLAALMYIKSIITSNKDFQRIKHVVIDEAQDLGEFNFYILKKILPSATFSIFGDLAQSIYDYRGINNWDEVNNVMFEKNGEIINFNKSYRTTAEIMSVADDVAESIGLNKSDLVVRHGEKVNFTEIDSMQDIPDYIIKKIEEYKLKGYKTIAVISKTNLLSCYINDDLSFKGVNIPNVSINDDFTDEKFNICTISNQLAKGLEFDAVIINNASENIYSSTNSLDMKLLYVAITRALHELDIVYTGELTKSLQSKMKTYKNDELKKILK